jgi:hypothetical protein
MFHADLPESAPAPQDVPALQPVPAPQLAPAPQRIGGSPPTPADGVRLLVL